MGKYEELKELSEKQFRRLTGVQRGTFDLISGIHNYEINAEAESRRDAEEIIGY